MTPRTRKRKSRLVDLANYIENLGLISKDNQIYVVTLFLDKLGLLENTNKLSCKSTKASRKLTPIETREHVCGAFGMKIVSDSQLHLIQLK